MPSFILPLVPQIGSNVCWTALSWSALGHGESDLDLVHALELALGTS